MDIDVIVKHCVEKHLFHEGVNGYGTLNNFFRFIYNISKSETDKFKLISVDMDYDDGDSYESSSDMNCVAIIKFDNKFYRLTFTKSSDASYCFTNLIEVTPKTKTTTIYE